MASGEQSESEHYRVIVLGQGGTEVLFVPNDECQVLPWVEIPRWQRVAENLTAAVKSQWGEEVVCLFELPTESANKPGITRYHAAEHLFTSGNPKMPTRWVPVSALSQGSFIEAGDCAVIKHVVAACNGEIERASVGPVARLGWYRELCDWIESVIEPMDLHLTGKFQQLNACTSFSLIRLETSGLALWFKAVGEPNLREFAVTCALAQLFPKSLPRILSSRPDWNGWLTWEVQGKLLAEVQDQALWEQTAGALARLQIQSIDHGSKILGVGARDLGSAALSKLIQPFMRVVAQLMERQTKIPPPILDCKDLSVVSDSLNKGFEAMEATGISDTLGHLDLNPGNIIISENGCVFLDWAEGYVGNPLFSLEYLVQHARRAFGENSEVRTNTVAAYCAQWDGVVPPAAIANALDLAPLLAVYAYAAGNDTWKQTERLQDAAAAGYLRSLARRMHRESKALASRRSACLA